MYSQMTSRILGVWLFFTILIGSSCSSEQNQIIADNINLEFELTYRYVIQNMSAEGRDSNEFSSFKQNNNDAFTSIAYTWHSIATSECGLADSSKQNSKPSSYDRLAQKSPTNNYLAKSITNKDRACLANIYLSHWPDIQRMLSLSFPPF